MDSPSNSSLRPLIKASALRTLKAEETIAMVREARAQWLAKGRTPGWEGMARMLELAFTLKKFAAGMPNEIKEVNTNIAAVLNRLPPRGVRPWLKFKPACPVSPLHRVRAWNRPDKCPKCGEYMEQNGLPFRLWD
jgi:hypothetical protein